MLLQIAIMFGRAYIIANENVLARQIFLWLFFPSLSIGTITQIYHRGEIQQFKLNHCTSSVKAGSKIEVTQVLTGQVAKIFPDQGLLVRLPMYKYGVVGLTDLSDNYEEHPLESFTTMQLVR